MKRNVWLFYLFFSLQSAWFIEAIWYFYWSHFLSFTTIGIFFGIFALFSLLLEYPTGVFADRFGRKRAVTLGSFLLMIGGVIIASAINGWMLFAGVMLQSAGRAFVSGALEALIYDSLKAHKQEEKFDTIMARKFQLATITFAICSAVGGYLFTIGFRLPHISMAIALLIAFVVSFFFVEERVAQPLHSSKELAIRGFTALWSPKLRPFLMIIFVPFVLTLLYEWGFSRPQFAISFGFQPHEMGILFGILGLVDAVVVHWLPQFRKKFSDYSLLWIGVVMSLGYLFFFLPIGKFGVLFMIMIEVFGAFADPWTSTIVNKHLDSSLRASALSAIQLLGRIPFFILNILVGYSIDHGYITLFNVSIGAVALILLLLTFMKKKVFARA